MSPSSGGAPYWSHELISVASPGPVMLAQASFMLTSGRLVSDRTQVVPSQYRQTLLISQSPSAWCENRVSYGTLSPVGRVSVQGPASARVPTGSCGPDRGSFIVSEGGELHPTPQLPKSLWLPAWASSRLATLCPT